MSAQLFCRWMTVTAVAILGMGAVRGDGLRKGPPWPSGFCPGGGCGPCGDPAYRVYRQSNYKPPCYHPTMPFGYYPTLWTRWPVEVPCPSSNERFDGRRPTTEPETEIEPLPLPTPIRPESEAEPLPAPRPLDMTRLFGGPRLPDLLPPAKR